MPLKALERAWKAFWFRALFAHVSFWRPERPLPEWGTGRRRILFMRPDGIGDAIVSTALLRAIGDISPDLQVDVLASPVNAPLVRQLPYVREVHVFDKRRKGGFARLALRLRRARYDAVIDPRIIAPSMTGLLLMLASGAPHRMGVGGRGADAGYTVRVPMRDGHIIDLLSGFAGPFGLDSARIDWRPHLPLTAETAEWASTLWEAAATGRPDRLLVNVSAGEPSRAWPEDRFVQVIRSLQARRSRLVLLVVGAPSEWERTSAIAEQTGTQAVSTPSMDHVAGLVAHADFVFTPDTSVAHVAAAFGKPTLAMYLKDTASRWGVYGARAINLESPTRSLADLPVSTVVPRLESLLDETSSAEAAS